MHGLHNFHGWLTLLHKTVVFASIVSFLVAKARIMQANCKDYLTSALPPSASAVQKLCQHGEKSNVHAMATLHTTQFKMMIEKKTTGIIVQLNTARQELIEKNQSRLFLTIDCIITCGRQNLASRGHLMMLSITVMKTLTILATLSKYLSMVLDVVTL